MGDVLVQSIRTSASGLEAQAFRLRIVAENLANAQSTGQTPGSDPYRRKLASFSSEIDRLTGASLVTVKDVHPDMRDFPLEHDPGNPAANAGGYVKMPNVSMLIELADMREANRGYEANLQAVRQAKEMIGQTIDLLRSGS